MYKGKTLGPFVLFGASGCLLPLLVIFNLLFGWMFLKPAHWLITEVVLVLFFIVKGYIFTRNIISVSRKYDGAIDVKGEVLEERDRLK